MEEEEIITPEEEVIIPEEEVFDYHKLRYILDKDGYVFHASLGGLVVCDLGECTEYIGEIPNDYETIEEWYDSEAEKINAWKIVDGNLVFDEDKYKHLQTLCKKQEEENQYSTHKWVNDRLKVSSSVVTDELASEAIGTSLIVLDDAGDYEIPELRVESVAASSVKAISSNKNILGINAVSSTINEVEIKVNGDGTITLNGTATDTIEFDLNGSNTNIDMLYLIKNNTDYAISGLTDNVSLSLYSYDGTDRAYVGNYINQSFNLTEAFKITQTILSIPSGATFENVVISPQIEIGEATEFIKHEEATAIGYLEDNECVITGLMSYSDKTIIMLDEEVNSSVKYYKYKYLNEKFSEIEATENGIISTVGTMSETVDRQNTAISQISQTVNEIKSEISDIADVTISADGYGSVHLEKINESEPIYIKINPTENEDISYLYPRDNLFPSDDLFPKGRTLRFENDDYVIDYELPDDLLYYDENNYDEFVLDYDAQTCEVNKKVGYNADGSKYLLETPTIISYDYPSIPIPKGDYTVTMLGYDNAFMFVRMMVENIYTNQFATKVELNSSISQTKDSITSEVSAKYATKDDLVTTQSTIKQTTDSINLEVAKKVNNTDYTSAQILLKINNDTSSTVIKSSKLDVDAIATFTNNKLAQSGATVINGSNITTGTIDASKVNVTNINANNITSGTISCSKLSGGTISGQKISGGTISGSTISGSTITTGSYFSVNSTGIATLKNNVGFLTLGRSGKHPWISGINVNKTNGISFTDGTAYNSLGSSVGGINFDGSAMYIKSDGTININHGANGQVGGAVGICDYSLSGHTFTGQGGAKMYANSNCAFLPADGYYAYVGSTSDATNRISTSGVGPSSLNVKENLEEINSEDVYKDIQNLKLYNYDYKYKGITDKQNDFGFIIDYVEELPTLSKFARHYNSKYYVDEDKKELSKIWNVEEIDKTKEVLDVKEWDRDSYIKMSMVMIKALQEKVDALEEEIKSLKESDK